MFFVIFYEYNSVNETLWWFSSHEALSNWFWFTGSWDNIRSSSLSCYWSK